MSQCNCIITAHRHGKDAAGYQKWRCPECGAVWSDNPNPRGPKPQGDRPLSNAERQRRKRAKKKAL